MMSRREREQERARQNRQELVNAGLTRRELARMGLLTAAGLLIPKSGLSARALDSAGAAAGTIGSPPTRPFIEPFRRLDVAAPCPEAVLGVAPEEYPNPTHGEGRTKPIQRFSEFQNNGTYYSMYEQEGLQSFHRDLPPQTIWGYGEKQPDGTIRPPQFPGPVYHARYGEPICVRMHNNLPAINAHVGYGRPETSTHLHNAHTASESDGNPLNYFAPGKWYDQHYPNIRAGYDAYPVDPVTGQPGDPRETMSTLWYHDHRFDFTAQNTYKGLEGMYMLFGAHDSGDETDPNPHAFRLPSGEFDVPMLFGDRVFDPASGQLYFDLFNLDGILGDKFTVNGVIQPVLQVHPRKYRFRCLNGGPSRFYQYFLTDLTKPSKVNPFKQISNDGNLLPAPVDVTSFTIGVAERMDIVIDFSQFAGKTLYLENRMEQTSGRGPTNKTLAAGKGNLVMKFEVVLPQVADPSQVPAAFFALPPYDLSQVATTRTFRFERTHGAWAINGKFFDPTRIDARPKQGTSEIWVIQNNSGGWQHPIHIHFEELQIISRNGKTPPVTERARKDVIRLGFNEEVRFHMRFRDWLGVYPMHCHNVVHEDHSMMLLWEIVP